MKKLEHKHLSAHFELLIDSMYLNRKFGENKELSSEYIFIWNKGESKKITIDNIELDLKSNTILPITHDQVFEIENTKGIIALKFNQEFYCIVNHDKEVGCVGFIFYGFEPLMPVKCDTELTNKLNFIVDLIKEEFKLNEENKVEMLRALLARFVIEITREAKKQYQPEKTGEQDSKFNLIRMFNLKVEMHFKKEHSVKFYAKELNVSPKTILGCFKLYSNKTPLQIIHERLITEAKRILYYTDKNMKEVAAELGFKSQNHFSKFYKSYMSTNNSKNL